MRTITKMLCGIAITAVTISVAAIDASAAAKPAPDMHPIATQPIVGAASTDGTEAPGYRGGSGYGRWGSWCYWHPYVCRYR
jgi:hypothetical protein